MRVLSVLFALVVTACAGTQESTKMCPAQPDSGAPFGQALRLASLHYENKATPEQLAIAGLSGLSTLDPDLTITRTPPRVVLQVPQKPIDGVTVSSEAMLSTWREKVVDIINTARQLSSRIEATPPEKLQATLISALKAAYPYPDKVLIPCPKTNPVVALPKMPDHCYGVPYGQGKTRIDAQRPVTPLITPGMAPGPLLPAEQRFVVMDAPLADPPEITRIQRGYVEHWVGGFINDGIVYWHAIDLDLMEIIRVQRRIYDQRAKLSRPFGAPELPDSDKITRIRKWSNDNRVEMEVVTRVRLRSSEAQMFVCVANGAWTDQTPESQIRIPLSTDTSVHRSVLLDRTENDGRHTGYWRNVPTYGALYEVVQALKRNLPTYPWPISPRQSP